MGTVEGIDLAPMSAIVSIDSECRYTLPEYVGSNVEVNIFTYDGKPTVYHYTDPKSYWDSVRYCAGLGMHLPVPNTEQQYQDLKTIPRYESKENIAAIGLGYTDSATEGIWLNIYNGEELAIDKWVDGGPNDYGAGQDLIEMYQYGTNMDFQWNDVSSKYDPYYYRSTLCMRTDLKIEIDFCKMNLHDCSSDAICNGSGSSYTCICPNVKIGDLDLEPAPRSTGKGSDGCHYSHPNADGFYRVFSVNYGGRDTVVYFGPGAGSNFYDYAAKCQSLGMRLLTPKNDQEGQAVYEWRGKPGAHYRMQVPMGVTRVLDGQWRNIYTGDKAWTNFYKYSASRDAYADRDFVIADVSILPPSLLLAADFGISKYDFCGNIESSKCRTVCIAPEDDETTEIDYRATGFNDCHVGATCTGTDNGYTCECQPLQFGDVLVAPIDVAETGKNCTYKIPGHDDKTLFPVRVNNNNAQSDTVYAFHAADRGHNLRDAIMYCGALGMHLPLPKNDKENAAMRKVLSGKWIPAFYFWLGISYSEDLTYLNIYTGEEPSYTNWGVDEPQTGDWNDYIRNFSTYENSTYWKSNAYTNVGMNRRDGKWAAYRDYKQGWKPTICQKGGVDISKFDWCAAGLHDCHVDANCLPSNNEETQYKCECKDPKFYNGNGIGENGCVFKGRRSLADGVTIM